MSSTRPFDVTDLRGRTALVTGASAGIGASFARALAGRGADVVLVARRADRLTELAAELTAQGVAAHVHAVDLAEPGAAERLTRSLAEAGITVDLLVNNAGIGMPHAPFASADPAWLRRMIDLNVGAVVELTRALLPDMIAKGSGAVVMVSSAAAFQPLPYMAAYSATKAFVLSLSEALWAETRDSGVRVLAVCPGMTTTEFFDGTGPQVSTGQVQTAEQVVAQSLRALAGQGPTVITGLLNTVVAQFPRFAPRRMVAWVSGRVARSMVSAPSSGARSPH